MEPCRGKSWWTPADDPTASWLITGWSHTGRQFITWTYSWWLICSLWVTSNWSFTSFPLNFVWFTVNLMSFELLSQQLFTLSSMCVKQLRFSGWKTTHVCRSSDWKFNNVSAEEPGCSERQIKNKHWAFIRKSDSNTFSETKSIERDLRPIITRPLSNPEPSLGLIIWCLAALCLTFPADVTFLVSVLIAVYLYARHQQTIQKRTPDFNPNHSGNMASCCCHESHKILQSQLSTARTWNSSSCCCFHLLRANPEKVWSEEAGPTSRICDITVWKWLFGCDVGDWTSHASSMFYIQTCLTRLMRRRLLWPL